MESESILRELKDLAEKMGVTVAERVLKTTPIRVQSGLCKVHGKLFLIVDKKLPMREKISVLMEALSPLPYDDVYIMPFVRELISDFKRVHKVRPPQFLSQETPPPDPENPSRQPS